MKWTLTYDFVNEYQLENMNVESILNLQSRLNSDQQILNRYKSHYDGGHSSGIGSKGLYCDTLDDRDEQYKCKGISP